MLRPMSMRNVHLPGTPGIYNTKPNWKPGPNWKPQSPTGPFIDGWAYATTYPVVPHNTFLFFAAFSAATLASMWLPFYQAEYQLKKNAG